MRIIDKCNEPSAIALGNFDGLHKAHMKIVDSCVEYARRRGILCGLVLFDRHPSEIFGKSIRLLTTMEEKLSLLCDAGVDFVNIIHFDEQFARTDGIEFIKRILNDFSVEAFFTGYDYSFGKDAKKGVHDLKSLGEQLGFNVFITECISEDGVPVSSTMVRKYLNSGDIEKANMLLSRRYSASGKVVHGKKNGSKLLFPTANIDVAENKLLPPDGVYATIVWIDGKMYRCATNIGKNPTFNAEKRTVEAFILDFDGELYGKVIRIDFIKRIRGDIKFEGIDELKEQIQRDIKKVQKIKVRTEG